MNLADILFYIFATILIASALRVITAKNPVEAVLFLVLSFVTSSCLWLMLNIEFLALTLILVYVGAVMVLFLFVVMMLDIDIEEIRKGFWRNLPLALILGVLVLAEIVFVLITKPIIIVPGVSMVDLDSAVDSTQRVTESISNAHLLGLTLYNQYSYPVELASMILLLGLVVAVALTLRKSSKNAKYQNIAKQVAVDAKWRMELVKMKSEIEENLNEGIKK